MGDNVTTAPYEEKMIGAKYSEAVDPIGVERTYTETNEPIDPQDNITGDEILSMLEEVL